MSDEYYGYVHYSPPMYSGYSDDYITANYSDPNRVYTPTNWEHPNTNIEKMWAWMQKESDERTRALAEMWRRTSVLLESTRENLKKHADALAAKWTSPAGEIFMGKVGATLYSLDEWKQIANDSASGLEQLATKIQTVQRDFKPLWEDYLAEQNKQEGKRKDDEGLQFGDIFGANNGDTPEEVQKKFHDRAVGLVKPLGELYIDVYISNISRGGKFKGPTNAAITDPSQVPRPGAPGAPGRPGGSRPGTPTGGTPPTRPNLRGRPDTPNLSDAPGKPDLPGNVPDGLSLAGTATAPPPTAPNVPSTPSPGPAPAGGPAPHTPMVPGVPGARGGPGPVKPTLPGTGSGPSSGPGARSAGSNRPGRPTLPGNTGPGAPGGRGAGTRGAPPSRPTLPGNTGTGSGPGARGLGTRSTGRPVPPSTPNLPGSTKPTGRSTGLGPNGRPATPPPSLGGKRGQAPGTPTGPGGKQPTSPQGGASSVTGTGKPGTPAQPNLTGRGAPGTGRPAPTTGPAPSLGGRRGPAVPPQRTAGRKPEDATEDWEYGDGDDELWVTESTAVGNIEAPTEHRPQQQGKALGQS
ncbi:hypothetical protein GCM10027280_19270 [Micromonospora polyrhachis]|uniref:Outer membrane channel protein CpnT-like N-terminal domain-containing protein n=1 Tax=Micromonospora polyrhachis TaxID=1282883 RepID=A0A7W7SLJ5_9ACTN|nr:hypothetical protein [Micromonospora polyrhachis]MBB4957022.1 hypothetical protein [Micromonospora polyrhachis]